ALPPNVPQPTPIELIRRGRTRDHNPRRTPLDSCSTDSGIVDLTRFRISADEVGQLSEISVLPLHAEGFHPIPALHSFVSSSPRESEESAGIAKVLISLMTLPNASTSSSS